MSQSRDDDKLWSRSHPSQELCTQCGRTLLQSRGFAVPGSTASWAEETKPSIPPAFHSVEQPAISLGRAAPTLADQSRHSNTMHHSSKAKLRNRESLAVAEEASGGGAVQRPQMPPLPLNPHRVFSTDASSFTVCPWVRFKDFGGCLFLSRDFKEGF